VKDPRLATVPDAWHVITRPAAPRKVSRAKAEADRRQLMEVLRAAFDSYLREALSPEEWTAWDDRRRYGVSEIVERRGIARRTLMRRRGELMAKVTPLWYDFVGPHMAAGTPEHEWLIEDARLPWREHQKRHDGT
jgi:hypothetical protein